MTAAELCGPCIESPIHRAVPVSTLLIHTRPSTTALEAARSRRAVSTHRPAQYSISFDAVDEKPFRPYAHPNPPPSLVLPSGRSHSLNPSSSAHDFAHTADRILCTSQLRFGPSWKVYTVSVACLPLFLATVAPLYQNAKTKSNLSRNTIVKETRRPPIGQQAFISPPSARVKESVLCSLYSGTRGCPLSAPEASNCRIRPSPPNHQTLGCRLSTFTWAYRLFATAHTNYRHSFAAHQELPARLT